MKTRRARCRNCGSPTTVTDLDTPAECEECSSETSSDLDAIREARENVGANWIATQRGTKGIFA